MPPGKRRKYSTDMVREAINSVKNNNMSIRGAARLHNIPESTLRDRLKDPRGAGVAMGGPTFFTPDEEAQLGEHCMKMAERGYGYARWQVMELASNMSSVKDKKVSPTQHWFYGFLKRNPQLRMFNPKKRETVRNNITPAVVASYFNELKEILEQYNLINQPAKIWNVDETGISLDHSPPKVLSRYGTQPFSITSGKSSTTTLVAAVSGLGQTIPPYIIYKGQRLTAELVSNGMTGTKYNTSANGWVTSEIFNDFFKNHFLVHVTERPLILLYDGHATHITTEIIDTARASDVHLFVLPPHSSHFLQPLDVSVFGAFKKSLNTEMHKHMHSHPNTVITRDLLPNIISTAYNSSMSVSNIMSGFRKTGIFPFDPEIAQPTTNTSAKTAITDTPILPHNRKERRDSRAIKVLFQEKEATFEESKNKQAEGKEPKKKRKTFVPPFGAAITEENFRELIQTKQSEKLEKENMKSKTASRKNESNTEPATKKHKFLTPYSNTQQDTGKDNVTDNVSTGGNNISTKFKGKSRRSSKGKGKCPAKKVNKIAKEDAAETDDVEEDNGICCICGKIQPDGLNLAVSISFVSWAQCDGCKGWVHLKYCSYTTEVTEKDPFYCSNCICH